MKRTRTRHRTLLLPALLALFGTATAAADDAALQSLESIRGAAESFLAEQVAPPPTGRTEITAGRLDQRLRLAACSEPLESFLPPSGRTVGNTTVGVRCNGEKPWTLYVPVRVALYTEVLVAARPLARGERVAAGDLMPTERDVSGVQGGYLTDPAQAVGHVVRRAVAAQAILAPKMIEAPHLVEKGQRVVLVAATGGVEVRMSGTALADGSLGEQIQVRNLSSSRVVEGRVIDQGTVQVNL